MSVLTHTPVRGIQINTPNTSTHDDWWCVKTDDWICGNCKRVCQYLTAGHLIVLWPAQDNPSILKQAKIAQEYERNPRIIKYKEEYGPAITHYEWCRTGNLVCWIDKRER